MDETISLFDEKTKQYHTAEKEKSQATEALHYREDEVKKLNPNDPSYQTNKEKYDKEIKTLTATIETKTNEQKSILEKINSTKKEGVLWDGILNQGKPYMPLTQADIELKTIAQDNERGKLLTNKETNIKPTIDKQTVANKDIIQVKQGEIEAIKKDLPGKINTIETDINKLNQDISDELQKAQTR